MTKKKENMFSFRDFISHKILVSERFLPQHLDELEMRARNDTSLPNFQQNIERQTGEHFGAKVARHIGEFDPSPHRSYTPWMVQAYRRGGINKLEDLSRTQNALKLFHRYKNNFKGTGRDIQSYHSLPDLEDAVQKYEPKPENAGNLSNRDASQAFINAGHATMVHDSPNLSVVVPHTREASCHFGVNTRWCTAATQSRNYFDDYSDHGKLMYFNHKPTNTKHAIFFPNYNNGGEDGNQTIEAFNARDDAVSPKNVLSKYSEAKKSIHEYLKTAPATAVTYAAQIHRGPMPELEPHIMKDPKAAAVYSYEVKHSPWPEAESEIMNHPQAKKYYVLAHELWDKK